MSDWKEYKLGELVVVNERSIGRNFNFEEIEYIDTSSVTENKFELPYFTARKDAPSRAKRLIRDGDTIISTVRPVQKHYGFIKKSKENQVVSTGFAVVTPKKIEPRFLYYFLIQPEITEYLNTIAEGGTTTFPAFRAEELNDLNINLPDLPIQSFIAEILSSLDDKIELNNKINQELETLAQTLFKQWFIDFEFPNENGEPYKSSGGEMVESELGEIPKGWKVGSLGDLCTIRNGYAFKSKDFRETGRNGILKIRNVNGNIVDIENTQFVEDSVINAVQEKFKVTSGNILVAMTGAEVGKIGIVPETNKSLWLNQRVGRFIPKIDTSDVFVHTMFNVLNMTSNIRNIAMGSAQPNISSSGIESIRCLIPSNDCILNFSESSSEGFVLIQKNLNENQQLTDLRDALLPKLISGELEINEINN
jgi:type I restriction enzyme, S subunit